MVNRLKKLKNLTNSQLGPKVTLDPSEEILNKAWQNQAKKGGPKVGAKKPTADAKKPKADAKKPKADAKKGSPKVNTPKTPKGTSYNIHGGNTSTKVTPSKIGATVGRATWIGTAAAGLKAVQDWFKPLVDKKGEHHSVGLYRSMASKISKDMPYGAGRAKKGSRIAKTIAKNKAKSSFGSNIDMDYGVKTDSSKKAADTLLKEWKTSQGKKISTAQTSSAPQSIMRKEGPNLGVKGGTGGEKMLKEWSKIQPKTPSSEMEVSDDFQDYSYGKKAKAPKPTSFDQKVSNFLGTTFKMHTWKEKNGQMVPDKSGVTASPTGEGLDLFGGGKRRRKKAAVK